MNVMTMCTAETMTAERIEDYGVAGIAEPGAIVTIYRVRPDGAASFDTFVIFTLNRRGCWRNNDMDLWGDADRGEDGKWRLWLGDRPDRCGGDWYIAPELGRWMNRLGTADAGYSLDPQTATREAEEAGRCWAENLERREYAWEEFSRIVANANNPEFPDFPSEELYEAAYEAAYDEATAAR